MNRRGAMFGAQPTPVGVVVSSRVDPRRERRIRRRRARDAARYASRVAAVWATFKRLGRWLVRALDRVQRVTRRAIATLARVPRYEGGEIPPTRPDDAENRGA